MKRSQQQNPPGHLSPVGIAIQTGHMGVTAGPAVSEASIGSRGVSVVTIESISVSLGISCGLRSGLGLRVPLPVVREAVDGAAHVAGRVSEGVGMEGNAGSVERSVGLGLGFTLAEGMAHQSHGPAAKAGGLKPRGGNSFRIEYYYSFICFQKI